MRAVEPTPSPGIGSLAPCPSPLMSPTSFTFSCDLSFASSSLNRSDCPEEAPFVPDESVFLRFFFPGRPAESKAVPGAPLTAAASFWVAAIDSLGDRTMLIANKLTSSPHRKNPRNASSDWIYSWEPLSPARETSSISGKNRQKIRGT